MNYEYSGFGVGNENTLLEELAIRGLGAGLVWVMKTLCWRNWLYVGWVFVVELKGKDLQKCIPYRLISLTNSGAIFVVYAAQPIISAVRSRILHVTHTRSSN